MVKTNNQLNKGYIGIYCREDQADEYSTLKKELEQTAKNCRILSFKLRKAERKTETLEAEKLEAEKKCREVNKTINLYLTRFLLTL